MSGLVDDLSFDLLIKNGFIIDGCGGEGFLGSLGIRGNKIHKLFCGVLEEMVSARRVIDATGLVVCPGFVDTHTHDDVGLLHEGGHMLPKLSQGVTTVVVGNCGLSISPLTLSPSLELVQPLPLIGPERAMWKFDSSEAYVHQLTVNPPTINLCFLIGHTTLRLDAMQDSKAILERAANGQEIDHMKVKLRESLKSGAVGLSTGLWYDPSKKAPTSEVIALASVVSEFSGIHATHMRDEGIFLCESVEETILIGRTAGVSTVISHHKASGKDNWGKVNKSLEMITHASKTQKIAVDVYPYIAASTILHPENVKIADKVILTWSEKNPGHSGKELGELAKEKGITLEECAAQLSPGGGIFFLMSEEDVQTVLKWDNSMIGSDGLFFDTYPHPRLYGTFPRVLGHYSKKLNLFPIHEAIRKMTSLPASVFGLLQRGVLQENNFADITIFDLEKIEDTATFLKPKMIAAGISYVVVNGEIVFENGCVTCARPGVVLKNKK